MSTYFNELHNEAMDGDNVRYAGSPLDEALKEKERLDALPAPERLTMAADSSRYCGTHLEKERSYCARVKGHENEPGDKGHSPYPDDQGVRKPENVEQLESKLSKLELQVLTTKLKLDEAREGVRIKCMGWTVGGGGCGALIPVKNLTYIQTHWYTRPYSCSGGDYWNMGEGQFVCPHCGQKNRLYERPDVVRLSASFKDVKNTYDD